VGEEMLDLLPDDLWQVGVVRHLFPATRDLGDRHRNDLLVATGFIAHDQHADRTAGEHCAGDDRPGVGDQHVDRIAVLGKGVRNEPVVAGIPHRRVEKAVDEHRARILVELVLDRLAANRHLDDHVDLVGRCRADRNRVYAHLIDPFPIYRRFAPGRRNAAVLPPGNAGRDPPRDRAALTERASRSWVMQYATSGKWTRAITDGAGTKLIPLPNNAL
jgi:hypothetical protein